MIIMISLSIGFFIGYLAASLVNAARDYEMPEMRDHASGTRKEWARETPQQMVDIDYNRHPENGLRSYPTNTTRW